MPQPDLQLGGGYAYQWRCAVLLALNYLHELIGEYLGAVDAIHLEGERIGSGIDLEDINLLGRAPGGPDQAPGLVLSGRAGPDLDLY